jgi:hypothetical protein
MERRRTGLERKEGIERRGSEVKGFVKFCMAYSGVLDPKYQKIWILKIDIARFLYQLNEIIDQRSFSCITAIHGKFIDSIPLYTQAYVAVKLSRLEFS